MTNDGLNALTYNAANQLVTAAGATYSYDGAGLRVKKVVPSGFFSTTTVYVFSGAKVIAEYVGGSLSKEYIYSGASLVATHEGSTVKYHHADQLSMRVVTDASGNSIATTGHYPFGENWYETGGTNKLKFTSYERDGETINDYAMARYHVNRFGRFSSPDSVMGNAFNPQRLNRYAYVLNDPVSLIDPAGLDPSGLDELPILEGGCALNCWMPNSLTAPCVMCGMSLDMILSCI